MKNSRLLAAALLVTSSPIAGAIPNSFFGGPFFGPVIPATPRFGKNLTGDVLDLANWESGKLPGPWRAIPAGSGRGAQRMTANPVLFGAVPESVIAYRDGEELQEIEVTYLDAGTFFGFKLGGEKTHRDRERGEKRRSEFESHFVKLERDLRSRLRNGCGEGETRVLARSSALRSPVTDFAYRDFVIRLAARDGHSVGLSIFRKGTQPTSYLAPELVGLRPDGRAERLAAGVTSNERGDIRVGSLPPYQQGFTPYCGVGSLAMAADYLGLRIPRGALEAGAEFRNTGSARGSRVQSLYDAVAEELRMDLSDTPRFDPERVRRSLEAGIPVVVWRRVSREREDAHAAFAKKLTRDPAARLREPSAAQRARWPEKEKKGSPSHGSVITGINTELGEVIYSEPWGGRGSGDRRMRIEEMAATSYAVFYFRF